MDSHTHFSDTQTNFILRLPEVERRTGIKRAHIYNLIKKEKFPRPIPLGVRAVGWYSNDINKWIATRVNTTTN